MDAVFTELQRRLAARVPEDVVLPGVSLRESAVLVPLFMKDGEPHLLFTKRPGNLRSHAGQISFPGGGREPGDPTPLHTALRETEEELGIPTTAVEVLGRLDEIPTVTGYRIMPFVGLLAPGQTFRPSPVEIELLIEAPVRSLQDPTRARTEQWTVKDKQYDVHFYSHGEHVIWGATAAILKTLLELFPVE